MLGRGVLHRPIRISLVTFAQFASALYASIPIILIKKNKAHERQPTTGRTNKNTSDHTCASGAIYTMYFDVLCATIAVNLRSKDGFAQSSDQFF